jgi:hypothetical protein
MVEQIKEKPKGADVPGGVVLSDGKVLNPFDAPTPGESLTANPEQKFPWESPPQYTEVRPFMEDLFMQITEEERYIKLLGSIMNKTPIDEIAQTILYVSVRSGKINPDLMLLLVEPVLYLLLAMTENAGIDDYVLYEGEDADEMSLEDRELYLSESEKVKKIKPENIKSSSVEPSLLARVEELPTAEEAGVLPAEQITQEEEEV